MPDGEGGMDGEEGEKEGGMDGEEGEKEGEKEKREVESESPSNDTTITLEDYMHYGMCHYWGTDDT